MRTLLAALGALAMIGCAERETGAASQAAADSTLFLPPLPPLAQPSGAAHFSFSGLSVPATFDSLAAQFPSSRKQNYYIYVSDAESRDRITGLGFADDPGGWRRLSISFERNPGIVRPEAAARRYPRCEQVHRTITERFGAEDSLKQFADDTHARADRYWNHPGELMILLCIFEDNQYYARALTLERFPQ